MAQVVACLDQPSTYRDHKSTVSALLNIHIAVLHAHVQVDRETERRLLAQSSTLYVGNLSFYTTEAQIYECESDISLSYSVNQLTTQCSRNALGQKREEASNGQLRNELHCDRPDAQYHHGPRPQSEVRCFHRTLGPQLTFQNTVRVRIRRVLPTRRSSRLPALYIRDEARRAGDPMRSGSGVSRRPSIRAGEERWAGPRRIQAGV